MNHSGKNTPETTDSREIAMDTKTNQIEELQKDEIEFEQSLDPGIAQAVMILRKEGIETFESCQGGPGHSYLEPTIRFHGEYPEGFRAYSVALYNGLRVHSLRRIYEHQGEELKGPWWEMTFDVPVRGQKSACIESKLDKPPEESCSD